MKITFVPRFEMLDNYRSTLLPHEQTLDKAAWIKHLANHVEMVVIPPELNAYY